MGDMIDVSLIYTVGVALFSGGAAWGGTLMANRSIKEEQIEAKKDRGDIRTAINDHVKSDMDIQMDLISRLARIEGKLDTAVRRSNGD